MVSLIERSQRIPSVASWQRLRAELGIGAKLPIDLRQGPAQTLSDQDLAKLGAYLATVGTAELGDLAAATDSSLPELRLALRRLSAQLEASGMQVLDEACAQC